MSFCRNVDKFKAQCRRLLQPHKRDWGRVIRSMALFFCFASRNHHDLLVYEMNVFTF